VRRFARYGSDGGGTVQLIRSLAAVVEDAAFAVELNFLNGRKKLPGLHVFSLMQYDM